VRGDLVYLDAVQGADDAALLARWSAGQSSIYSSGRRDQLTVEAVSELVRTPGLNVLMVRAVADDTGIGMVTWKQQTYHGSYTLGIAVGDAERWGAGLGMESVMLLTSHLFHDLNAHRLHVEVAAYNLGMLPIFDDLVTVEGVMRDYFFVDGQYHDCVVGSILREEFYEIAAQFGGPADSVPAAVKQAARSRVDDLLGAKGLGSLSRLSTAADPGGTRS
jgi:RimJ/RimL family protein N-acetyltransferase